MSGKRAKARRRASGVIRDGGGVRQRRRTQPPWRWIGGMAAGAASGLLSVAVAWALPEGGVVASGSATIGQPTPSSMVVQQGSPQLILNWQGFSIGQGQVVRFDQPSSSAVALNRVVGQDPSQILGSLLANGRIFLTNPNGVLFGPSAQRGRGLPPRHDAPDHGSRLPDREVPLHAERDSPARLRRESRGDRRRTRRVRVLRGAGSHEPRDHHGPAGAPSPWGRPRGRRSICAETA